MLANSNRILDQIMMTNKREIIFFDGDGTLWYPRKTKRRVKPHWIYLTEGTYQEHCNHLMMIPGTLATIKKLKKQKVIIVLLSTNPHPPKEAAEMMRHRVAHFNLNDIFDEFHATREFHASKGQFILRILKKRGIPKNKALMVGDNYRWDYKPARDVGVDALLIESEYMKNDRQGKRIKKTIKKLSEVLEYF
jgi:FMN phosphatase YigB (HAD superfamily)